jgi:hypothetical protein
VRSAAGRAAAATGLVIPAVAALAAAGAASAAVATAFAEYARCVRLLEVLRPCETPNGQASISRNFDPVLSIDNKPPPVSLKPLAFIGVKVDGRIRYV